MIKVEPLINAEDYSAFQAMMPNEPAFKDAPTGTSLDFAKFSTRENIRIQSGARLNKTIIMVSVQPAKFEQYCENYDKDRNWQSLAHFADAKFDMARSDEQDGGDGLGADDRLPGASGRGSIVFADRCQE
jgi:hypothetical protein